MYRSLERKRNRGKEAVDDESPPLSPVLYALTPAAKRNRGEEAVDEESPPLSPVLYALTPAAKRNRGKEEEGAESPPTSPILCPPSGNEGVKPTVFSYSVRPDCNAFKAVPAAPPHSVDILFVTFIVY